MAVTICLLVADISLLPPGFFFPGAPPSLFCLLLLTHPPIKRSIRSIIFQLDVFWMIIGTKLHSSHKEASGSSIEVKDFMEFLGRLLHKRKFIATDEKELKNRHSDRGEGHS